MSARHLIEYLLAQVLLLLGAVLPRSWILAIGRGLGEAWFRLDSTRRLLTLRNLEIALGSRAGAAERREIARQSFRSLCQSAIDFLTLPHWRPEDFQRRVRVEGIERIQSAYREGKGVLLFSGHFGLWEIVPIVQATMGLPLSLVVRPLDNPLLDGLLTRLRERTGNRLIKKHRAVREVLRTLGDGGGIAIVIDQNVRRNERVFVRFFDRPAATIPTLGVMALRTGAALVPVFCIPEPGGRYTIRYEQALDVPRTGDRDLDAWEITQRATSVIEEYVRTYPEAWLWMHDRFRSHPKPGEPGPEDYERRRPFSGETSLPGVSSTIEAVRLGVHGRRRAGG